VESHNKDNWRTADQVSLIIALSAQMRCSPRVGLRSEASVACPRDKPDLIGDGVVTIQRINPRLAAK